MVRLSSKDPIPLESTTRSGLSVHATHDGSSAIELNSSPNSPLGSCQIMMRRRSWPSSGAESLSLICPLMSTSAMLPYLILARTLCSLA